MDTQEQFWGQEAILTWLDVAKFAGEAALEFITNERVIKTAAMVGGLVGMLLERE